MLTRRTIVITAFGAAVAATAAEADADPTAFVAAIYAAYKGKNAKGITLDNESAIRRYFEPSFAALIIKDQKDAARRKEVPTLDGDPFVDAQDWEIAGVDITLSDTTADKTNATVKFRNGDQPTTVVLALVRSADNWRISNITWQHDGKPETLRGLYGH